MGGLRTVPCLPCMGHCSRQVSCLQSTLTSTPAASLPHTAGCIMIRPDRQDIFCRAKILIWWCLVSTEVTTWASMSFTLEQLVLQRKLLSRQATHNMQANLALCCLCAAPARPLLVPPTPAFSPFVPVCSLWPLLSFSLYPQLCVANRLYLSRG